MADTTQTTSGRPLTDAEMTAYRQADAFVQIVPLPSIKPNATANQRTIFAALDGTWNNRDASSTDIDTNPAQLERLVSNNPLNSSQVATVYEKGVGTGGFLDPVLGGGLGAGLVGQAEKAYEDIATRITSWRNDNPNADINIILAGFSRGSAAARHLANLINERGIVDPASARKVMETDTLGQVRWTTVYDRVVIPAGQARIGGLLLYDTVVTGQEAAVKLGIPPNVDSVLHLVAKNEPRNSGFQLESILGRGLNSDPRLMEVWLAAAHTDLGGGYDKAIGMLSLGLGGAYLNKIAPGLVGAIPDNLRPTGPFIVHDSSWGAATSILNVLRFGFNEPKRVVNPHDAPAVSPVILQARYPDWYATQSPAPVENSVTITTTTTPAASQTAPSNPTSSISDDTRTLYLTSGARIEGIGNVNEVSGNRAYANNMLAGGIRPGAHELVDEISGSLLAKNLLLNPDLAKSPVLRPEVLAAATNILATGVQKTTPTDPLILDLNGDGVKLTSFADAPVLFDIDLDGKKEATGWVSAQDGIVVMDLNGNDLIDGVHETMSEYFRKEVGAGETAGGKPYANGFAALASLDEDSNQKFTADDTNYWNKVKVWVDADHDGQTDGDELKTLDELGITSIDLAPTMQSGLVNGGNEILASGSFVQNGLPRDAQAARLIANPNGNTLDVGDAGIAVRAQDGQSTYVSTRATGETVDVANVIVNGVQGVKNAYGHSGNDHLIGDANANWLVGGPGSDTLSAGDGDDVLLIDAEDKQQNIDAGDGFDMVQVVGNAGVTFNLAQAHAEIVIGGGGDDILIGGGRASVFIRAGDGDDIVIGSAANDALSGENGADLIDGGAGHDVIRGGRGDDQLMGGIDNDVIFGGQDDDRLSGGEGNDVLRGEQGDDSIDGGAGDDVVEFSGSIADYQVIKLADNAYRVVDTKAGREGVDILTNVEKLSFADVSGVDITLDNPIPVKDVASSDNRDGMEHIKVADLLANDRDWQGDDLHITSVSDIQGGAILGTLSNGELIPTLIGGQLQFTPDPTYSGVMSFKYKIADNHNTPGLEVIQIGTPNSAEMRGQVFIKTRDMPTDSLFTDQWYLNDINVLPVWKDYTGKGVKIGQFEPGMPFSTGPEVFDYRHPDLQANVDPNWFGNPNGNIPQSFSRHATLVAGVMAAARNGEGAVGVAYDAKLSGHYFPGTGFTLPVLTQGLTDVMAQFKNYDVVNNSWGNPVNFAVEVTPIGELEPRIRDAITLGRNGLGTTIVMAGGNGRAIGGNTNTNALTANRAVIVTGAINAQTDISTLKADQKPFSNPGASILVSAPGSNITSTSRILMSDDGSVFGSDALVGKGTSLAAPIVSGVVALMLEANPHLGWRDIQKILAITAKKVDDQNTDTIWNGATNWNGGGMHASHDYGFGEVDARAAVRLAEIWSNIHTVYNERHSFSSEGSMSGGMGLDVAINDNATFECKLNIKEDLRVEHASVSLDLTHGNWGDLVVELISPAGTVSKLVATPGTSLIKPGGDTGSKHLKFSMDTTHNYGENAHGDWKLRITDRVGLGTGTLNGWAVDVYGSDLIETADSLAKRLYKK